MTVALLQIFFPNILDYIDGLLIDRPSNGLSLCPKAHKRFGRFSIWFEKAPGSKHSDNTYLVLASGDSETRWLRKVIRERNLPEDRVVDRAPECGFQLTLRCPDGCQPPHPELLRTHAAIAKVLRLAAVGYVSDEVERQRGVWDR